MLFQTDKIPDASHILGCRNVYSGKYFTFVERPTEKIASLGLQQCSHICNEMLKLYFTIEITNDLNVWKNII